jgi:hypothetical protein
VITLLEATQIFKVSVPTVYRWIKQDSISYRYYDGMKVYDLDALQNAYEKRRSKAQA